MGPKNCAQRREEKREIYCKRRKKKREERSILREKGREEYFAQEEKGKEKKKRDEKRGEEKRRGEYTAREENEREENILQPGPHFTHSTPRYATLHLAPPRSPSRHFLICTLSRPRRLYLASATAASLRGWEGRWGGEKGFCHSLPT